MATWNTARGPMICQRCSRTIGADEVYRVVAGHYRHCAACSEAMDGQTPPATMPVLSVKEGYRARMTPMAALVRQPFKDVVAKATQGTLLPMVEREPGEDD